MIDVVTGSDPDVTSFPLSSIRIHVEKVNQEFFYQLRNICGAACKGKLVWRSSVYEINLPACHHDHADDDSNTYVLLKRIFAHSAAALTLTQTTDQPLPATPESTLSDSKVDTLTKSVHTSS